MWRILVLTVRGEGVVTPKIWQTKISSSRMLTEEESTVTTSTAQYPSPAEPTIEIFGATCLMRRLQCLWLILWIENTIFFSGNAFSAPVLTQGQRCRPRPSTVRTRLEIFECSTSATTGGEELIVQVQRAGENVFGAMLVVAMVQALVALIEYRTNPQGELIVPPGLTYGTATGCTSTGMPPGATATVPVDLYSRQRWVEHLSSNISTETSQYSRIINRINQGMVVLIPWASQMLGWLLRRNTHLFHFGFIILVAGLFDIPNRWIAERWQKKISIHGTETHSKDSVSYPTSTSPDAFNIEYVASHEKPIRSLVVIGDSLAVGLGSVNVYDAAKNNSMPFYRIENIDAERTEKDAPGPVFPRVLAETLAYSYKSNVRWRSAGVDGGDVALIQEFCFGIIEEEVAKGGKPDVVVILCGVNDLKYFVSNPFQGPGPRIFRRRLDELIQKIQYTCGPHTKIVVPMFPTQMFRANSPLNIFPLNFFLDGIVGFWDSQKKLVADRYRSDNVLYVGLRPSEILEWYQKSISNDELETASTREGLIAADGIHPNAKCYSLWAKFLAAKLWNDGAHS